MEKLQLNRTVFLFIFLIAHHTAMYSMQHNKRSNATRNFPQQKQNHTGGKIIKEPRSQNLGDRLMRRFLTELPKQPIDKIKPAPEPSAPASDANILLCNYNYPIHHDFDLEWTEK
jgi:hypothetical protein